MATNNTTSLHQEKERAFLTTLEADSGRTLAQWMEAIRAAGVSERNDIIDWLRAQGFRFSRASWLERVHHNGGRPIYADRPEVDRATVRRPPQPRRVERNDAATPRATVLGTSIAATPAPVVQRSPQAPPAAPPVRVVPEAPLPASAAYASAAANVVSLTFADPLSPEVTALTAKAKAYRPLADFLLREIAKAVPAARYTVSGQSIAIGKGQTFATLSISARELKLAIARDAGIALTDARQVDQGLLSRVRAAAAAVT